MKPMNTTNTASVKAWVGCLAAYNNGNLHGAWLSLDDGEDAFREGVKRMLETSPEPTAEEWLVLDWDDETGFLDIMGETSDISAMFQRLETFDELQEALGEDVAQAAIHWYDHGPLDEMVRRCQDAYSGSAASAEEWITARMKESGELHDIPERLRCYIDFEAIARDAMLGGDVSYIWEDGEHVNTDRVRERRYGYTVHAFYNH